MRKSIIIGISLILFAIFRQIYIDTTKLSPGISSNMENNIDGGNNSRFNGNSSQSRSSQEFSEMQKKDNEKSILDSKEIIPKPEYVNKSLFSSPENSVAIVFENRENIVKGEVIDMITAELENWGFRVIDEPFTKDFYNIPEYNNFSNPLEFWQILGLVDLMKYLIIVKVRNNSFKNSNGYTSELELGLKIISGISPKVKNLNFNANGFGFSEADALKTGLRNLKLQLNQFKL